MKKIVLGMICSLCCLCSVLQATSWKEKAQKAWTKTKDTAQQGVQKAKEALSSERAKNIAKATASAAMEGGINAAFEGGDMSDAAQSAAQASLVSQAKKETVNQAGERGGQEAALAAQLAVSTGEGYQQQQQRKQQVALERQKQQEFENAQAQRAHEAMVEMASVQGLSEKQAVDVAKGKTEQERQVDKATRAHVLTMQLEAEQQQRAQAAQEANKQMMQHETVQK